MIPKIRLYFLCCLLSLTIFSQQTNFIKQKSYGSVKISHADLQKIITSIEYYNSQNLKDTTAKKDVARVRFEVKRDDKSVTANSISQILDFKYSNEKFTSLTLTYSWEDKPLAEVVINMDNYSRTLSISGTDVRIIEALYSEIDKVIVENESSFSWIKSSFLLFIFSTLLLGFISFIIIKRALKLKERPADLYSISLTVGSVATMLLTILIPFRIDNIFPNFLLTYESVNWIDRNANLLGFISFLITILGILYKLIKWIISKKSSAVQT